MLQIFRLHARTSEAKLQIALAEVPYLRSRMSEMHVGHLDGFEDGLMARTLAKNHSLKEKMEFLDVSIFSFPLSEILYFTKVLLVSLLVM